MVWSRVLWCRWGSILVFVGKQQTACEELSHWGDVGELEEMKEMRRSDKSHRKASGSRVYNPILRRLNKHFCGKQKPCVVNKIYTRLNQVRIIRRGDYKERRIIDCPELHKWFLNAGSSSRTFSMHAIRTILFTVNIKSLHLKPRFVIPEYVYPIN